MFSDMDHVRVYVNMLNSFAWSALFSFVFMLELAVHFVVVQ